MNLGVGPQGYDLSTCPRSHLHTAMPDNYTAWHVMSRRLSREGARQERCEKCGLWAIWLDGVTPIESAAHWIERRESP